MRRKNLKIHSVDLCKMGANPMSWIALKKSLDHSNMRSKKEDANMSWKNSMRSVTRKKGKDAVKNKMIEAMVESLSSIVLEEALSDEEKEEMIYANVCDFYEDIRKSSSNRNGGREEENAAEAQKNYQLKKALAQVEELKKAIEVEHLLNTTEKFQILGQDPYELADTLYEMKKSNDTLYEKYLISLENQAELISKSGMFREIGSNRAGAQSNKKQLEDMIRRMMENDSKLTYEQAYIKACDDNPELKRTLS